MEERDMNIPENLKYTKTHEWVEELSGGKAKVGITDHAQDALGDLVYVELPAVGDSFAAGDDFAVVESVKATSDVISPVSGTVCAINEELTDMPATVNEDCYSAWFIELEGIELPKDLMSAAEYSAFLESEA